MSAPFVVTIDKTRPTVAGIRRLSPADRTGTAEQNLVYRVTFSEPVNGVQTDNFTLTKGDSTVTGDISNLSQVDASTYDVSVTGAGGDNTLRLDLKTNQTGITDLAGNSGTAAYTGGQTFTMRHPGSGWWEGGEDGAGAWNAASLWYQGAVAGGLGATADFSGIDIEETATVTLDSPLTLGRLIFADADEDSPGAWRVAGTSTNASITLANLGGATPEVKVTYENMGDGGTQDYHKAANGRNYPVIIDTPFSSSSGLLKTGWGTLQLNNIGVFSGSIGVQQGYLRLGPGAALNMTQPLNLPAAGSGLIVAGGTFSTTAGVNMVFTSENMILVSDGRADFKAITSGNNRNGRIQVTGGIMTADEIMLQRSADGSGGYGNGLIVKGGTATIGTLGVATNNSWGAVSVEGGKLIVTGPLWNGWQASSGRGGQIRVTSGELVSTDTVNGIVMSRKNGSNANNIAELHITGGTVTAARIALGYDSTVTAGSATINLNAASAALYLGEQGLVKNGAFTTNINLTRGTLGADSTWSTTVPMVVTSGSGNITIKAASAAGVPHDITLAGVLSGSGTMTKTGGGTLTLSAANTHTGAIAVNDGTLAVNGSLAADTNPLTVNAGAFLGGSGTINRPVVLNGGGLVVGAAPLTVAALNKQGAGPVALRIGDGLSLAPGSRVTVATFGSTDLTGADLVPMPGDGVLLSPELSSDRLELAVIALPAPNGSASGITGGGDTPAVLVSTAADFKALVESPEPAVVIVSGLLDLSSVGGPVTVASNKTLLGQNSDSTISGLLTLPAGTGNVILRGLNFTNAAGNGLALSGATGVLVTHCTFFDCDGALVSIGNGSDNITVSWSEFYYTGGFAGQRTAMRIGAPGDESKLNRVTLHHNHWSEGCVAGMPVSSFGYVHMFANYLLSENNTSATVAGDQSQLLSAHNLYQDMLDPLAKLPAGSIRMIGNTYVNTTGTTDPGEDIVFVPSYSHVLDTAETVGTLVPVHAGNTAGAASLTPPQVSGSASVIGPDNAVPNGGSFMLVAHAQGLSPVSYQWHLDNFPIPDATAINYSVADAKSALHAGPYSVALTLTSGETVVSGAYTVTVGELAPPRITRHPVAQAIRPGDTASFTVKASGDELRYQWQKDGADIAGANTDALFIVYAKPGDAGSYRVVVTNDAGSVTSYEAVLSFHEKENGGGGATSGWFLALAAAALVLRMLSTRRRE
ncbi:immunoglobulin domain-containing protein [Termitidicoccus mucosus]